MLGLVVSLLFILIAYNPAFAVSDLLASVGFTGPFAVELAPYLEARRALEDGPNRPITVSMNGMIPASPCTEVMDNLCLEWYGHSVTKVPSNDGQGSYCIRGPRAHEWSCVAIACLWDKYVNDRSRFRFRFPENLRYAWNESKVFSRNSFSQFWQWFQYYRLREDRVRAIEAVNRMYGPGGEAINRRLRRENAQR